MSTKKIQTGLRLSESMYNKLKQISIDDGRSMNNLVERIIQKYIESYERDHGPITPSQD